MVGFVKLAAGSAVLAYAVVMLSNAAPAVQAGASGKAFHDRITPSEAPAAKFAGVAQAASPAMQALPGKGDRLASAGCASQTWPYISPECAPLGTGPAKKVRVITIESRVGANVSVLARTPQTNLAQR